MKKYTIRVLLVFYFLAVLLAGCDQREKTLVVYAGKGLKTALDEIVIKYQQNQRDAIKVVYAGSKTLLTSMQSTGKGDIFMPGSYDYIEEARSLITSEELVALHEPTFVVRADNQKGIQSYADLAKPGVRIAIGNKNMCAIGKVGDKVIQNSHAKDKLINNIVITSSTVNELLDLVIAKEVDASLVWSDMLEWPEAKELKMLKIPNSENEVQEIHVAVLASATDRKSAEKFADFVAKEGRKIFVKHGFGEK